jgi:hypothetical protein
MHAPLWMGIEPRQNGKNAAQNRKNKYRSGKITDQTFLQQCCAAYGARAT